MNEIEIIFKSIKDFFYKFNVKIALVPLLLRWLYCI